MNVKGHANRVDLKREELLEELNKEPEEQNYQKIRRLKQSIERNKNILKYVNRRYRSITTQ